MEFLQLHKVAGYGMTQLGEHHVFKWSLIR